MRNLSTFFSILAIVLIGVGCAVFFLVYEKDEKMSQEILSEEPSVVGKRSPRPYDVLIYWTNRSGRIQCIRSDGSDVENLTTDVCSPIGIALDISGSQMYWTSGCKIQRANLDGSNVEDVVTDSILTIGIALSTASQ